MAVYAASDILRRQQQQQAVTSPQKKGLQQPKQPKVTSQPQVPLQLPSQDSLADALCQLSKAYASSGTPNTTALSANIPHFGEAAVVEAIAQTLGNPVGYAGLVLQSIDTRGRKQGKPTLLKLLTYTTTTANTTTNTTNSDNNKRGISTSKGSKSTASGDNLKVEKPLLRCKVGRKDSEGTAHFQVANGHFVSGNHGEVGCVFVFAMR